jgi:hypothetical protein
MPSPERPRTTRVGFHDPILRGSPKLAELVRQWLLGYQAGHCGAIASITVTASGEPPRIELWVELPSGNGHIDEIVMGVHKLILSETREAGLVMVPKSLINKFSKPLDFRTTKC